MCNVNILSLTKHKTKGDNKMKKIFYAMFIGIVLFTGYHVANTVGQNMKSTISNRVEILNSIK